MTTEPPRAWVAPIDPVPIGNGASHVLPLPDGRTVWQFRPIGEDADADLIVQFGDYIETLRGLGHVVVVGDEAALLSAAVQELRL